MTDDLDRLRLLHAVARTGTIAAAARDAGFTPSAVSQQLAALERRVGTVLLERSNRGVVLTAAGAALAARADVLLDELQTGLDEARRAGGVPAAAPIRVAAFPTAVAALVLPAVLAAAAGGRTLGIVVVDLEPEAALAALVERAVDLAVVDRDDVLPDPLPSGLVADRLAVDRMALVVPAGIVPVGVGPAGVGPAPGIGDLPAVPWVLGAPGGRLGRVGRALCSRHGVVPRVAAETDDHHLAYRIAAALGAATIQPGLALGDLPPDGALVALDVDLGAGRAIDLVRRRSRAGDPALALVADALRDAARSAAAVCSPR